MVRMLLESITDSFYSVIFKMIWKIVKIQFNMKLQSLIWLEVLQVPTKHGLMYYLLNLYEQNESKFHIFIKMFDIHSMNFFI